MGSRVLRIQRIGLSVADLEAATKFYVHALGFTRVGHETRGGALFEALTGVAGARAETALLRLGGQEIELAAFEPAGRPYPEPRAGNDPWFQHFAIAVADMPRAYAQLSASGQQAISQGGPQLLPPSTGSVTAYKFRDPEGHPLELSYIPHSAWTERAGVQDNESVFLGVDHSAIAVRDLGGAINFYTGALGLEIFGGSLNRGPEQDRLDGLSDTAVDIVALKPRGSEPHLELLHYRSPKPGDAQPEPLHANDVAATRLVLEVEDVAGLFEVLQREGRTISAGVIETPTGLRALARDPDGHLLELLG